jgi:hypothetical protein
MKSNLQNLINPKKDCTIIFKTAINILLENSITIKKYNNLFWDIFLNLFTEEYIFIKNIDKNTKSIEPLPFSLIEIYLFGFNNEEENGKNEKKFIEESIDFFISKGYDLDRNDFYIKQKIIFEKIYSFIKDNKEFIENSKKKSEKLYISYSNEKKKISYGGDNPKILNLSIENKEKYENIRQPLNSAHNFLGSRCKKGTKLETKVSNGIKKSIKHNLLNSVIKNIQQKSLATIKEYTKINNNSKEEKLSKKTLCKEFPKRKHLLNTTNYCINKEIKLAKKNIFSTEDSNKNNNCSEVINAKSEGLKYFINYTKSDFESIFLIDIMQKNYIGKNVIFFAFNDKSDENYKTYFKNIMSNTISKYDYIINDASGYKQILNMLSKKKNNYRTIVQSFNAKQKITIRKESYYSYSWGSVIDPQKTTSKYQKKLFNENIYINFLINIFSDLQLHNLKLDFDIVLEENLLNGIKIIFTNKNNTKENSPFVIIPIKSKKSEKNEKSYFEACKINNFIIKIIEKHYIEKIKNKIKEINKIPKNNKEYNNKVYNIILKSIPNLENIPKSNNKNDYMNVYEEITRILFSNSYNFYEVIRFILRFKILGDKIQALEAKYNCSLINFYGHKNDDILVKSRILATQDRPLSAYAQLEGDVNFISKATLNNYKVIYWNFGDAKESEESEESKESNNIIII